MLCFTRPDPRVLQELGDLNPLRLANPRPRPERLRHLGIGSPDGVRATIHQLHMLTYAEQATWSQLITIPESGILITPEQGEVFSYLARWRQLSSSVGWRKAQRAHLLNLAKMGTGLALCAMLSAGVRWVL